MFYRRSFGTSPADRPSRIVVQFEDFKNPFPSLAKYQNRYPCFNDDIQGTGAVILAGIINALRRTGIPIKDQRAVFMGAGSAGVGVAQQIVEYFQKEGLTEDEARRCFWFVDTKVSTIHFTWHYMQLTCGRG
jgi:malate dehydrogenase (oxaloacetate-decarboxylating)(NADP+)